jgi:hypothetical protein
MQCPICSIDNPIDNRFCGQCGGTLDPKSDLVTQQINRVLEARFKDRALIEYQVTDTLVTRFSSYLKWAALLLTPALFIFGIAVSIAIFLGFKTFNNAADAIKKASTTAVAEVQEKAVVAEQAIATAQEGAKLTNASLDSKAPQLQRELDRVNRQLKGAAIKIAGIAQSAEENQRKLAQIKDTRTNNPTLPIGELNSTLVTPSFPQASVFTNSGIASIPFRTYTLGDSGDAVMIIQNRLREAGCYKGQTTGSFDKATADAVIAFKRAKDMYTTGMDILLTQSISQRQPYQHLCP